MKGCKGCYLLSMTNMCSDNKRQGFTKDGVIYICPCQTCLLKGICSKSCKEYLDFLAILRELTGKICREYTGLLNVVKDIQNGYK